MTTKTRTYQVRYTADVEGNWCVYAASRLYPTREAAQAALAKDGLTRLRINR